MPKSYILQEKDPFFGIGCHDALLIQVPPVQTKAFHISFCWGPLGVNGLDLCSIASLNEGEAGEDRIPRLGPDDLRVMGRTTDAGFVIGHISIPINNALLPLTILFGSSMTLLGSSQVRVDAHSTLFGDTTADVACALPWTIPIGLNLSCNDPLPICGIDIFIPSTNEVVDVSWSDFLACMLDVLQEVAIAGAFMAGGKLLKKAKKSVKSLKISKKGKLPKVVRSSTKRAVNAGADVSNDVAKAASKSRKLVTPAGARWHKKALAHAKGNARWVLLGRKSSAKTTKKTYQKSLKELQDQSATELASSKGALFRSKLATSQAQRQVQQAGQAHDQAWQRLINLRSQHGGGRAAAARRAPRGRAVPHRHRIRAGAGHGRKASVDSRRVNQALDDIQQTFVAQRQAAKAVADGQADSKAAQRLIQQRKARNKALNEAKAKADRTNVSLRAALTETAKEFGVGGIASTLQDAVLYWPIGKLKYHHTAGDWHAFKASEHRDSDASDQEFRRPGN